MEIRLENLTKVFTGNKGDKSGTTAVDNLDITIPDGKLVGLLGPSGCGKSTTLYMISGLLEPTSGKIWFGDEDVTEISPEHRGIGLVFQNYALYPHMTVRRNIAFPLENLRVEEEVVDKNGKAQIKKRKLTKAEIDIRVMEAAKLVQIEEYLDRKPNQLSGGQQQRVAIARTLAPRPKVLFMDEPLSNLDAKLRLEMRTELKRLHLETNSTFVYVTHDQLEAMTLATNVCLMKEGLLQQYEPPLKVYSEPNNLFVADFVGNPTMNFVNCSAKQISERELEIDFHGTPLRFMCNEEMKLENEEVVLGIRPEHIVLSKTGLKAKVYSTLPSGMETTVKIFFNDDILTSVVFGIIDYAVDTEVHLQFTSNHIVLFDKESTNRIAIGELKMPSEE